MTTTTLEDISEAACGQAMTLILNHVSSTTKIPAAHLALEVPGSCHVHSPTSAGIVDGCAYCARKGNCFAARPEGQPRCIENEDMVAEAVQSVLTALRGLVERVLDRLDSRGVATCKTRDELCSFDLETMLLRELERM